MFLVGRGTTFLLLKKNLFRENVYRIKRNRRIDIQKNRIPYVFVANTLVQTFLSKNKKRMFEKHNHIICHFFKLFDVDLISNPSNELGEKVLIWF